MQIVPFLMSSHNIIMFLWRNGNNIYMDIPLTYSYVGTIGMELFMQKKP